MSPGDSNTPDDPAQYDETVLVDKSAKKEEYIGKYLIEGILGEGAMGIVYKGFDTTIRRHVAIKTIHGALLLKEDGEEFLERFRREAQAAGRLVHPNVVTVFEFGHHEGTPYLVLEFIPGQELKQLITSSRLTFEKASAIFVQMLSGLGVAHSAGIVHRDIKPQNIFVMSNGLTKVGDFGIARVDATGFTRTGMILGTPSYMSPEQFTGAELDHRSDLYSASAVLYEMLTGVKVFSGQSVTEVMYAVLEKDPPSADSLVATVPASVAAVVSKGLAKRPEDRYQSADEFRLAFEDACKDADVAQRLTVRPRGPSFASTTALTSESLRSVDVGLDVDDAAWRLLIDRRTRGELDEAASQLLRDAALETLGYDDLVHFVAGLRHESDPRLTTLTLAAELSKRDHEQSERNRLDSSVRHLAHSAEKSNQ